MVYLDWASTSPPDDLCIGQAMEAGHSAFGNPSSPHGAGKLARELLESSRASLADALGCTAQEMVFTSCATESNWIVLSSVLTRLRAGGGTRRVPSVVATGIEHSSIHDNLAVLESFGVRVRLVPAQLSGSVKPEDVASRLDPDTVMVAVMSVNNVTGALQPVREISALARHYSAEHGRRIIVHTDAVQALGKVPCRLDALGADTASFSAHKIGGPRGIGALFVKAGTPLEPLARAGEQEFGYRGGTENCVGAAAFACAARRRVASLEVDQANARRNIEVLRAALAPMPGCAFLPADRFAPGRERAFSPYIVSVAFPPVPSDVLVRILAAEDVCVSSGSACAARDKAKRERVYRNMGLAASLASSAIRISTGPSTTPDDMERCAEVLRREIPRMTAGAT